MRRRTGRPGLVALLAGAAALLLAACTAEAPGAGPTAGADAADADTAGAADTADETALAAALPQRSLAEPPALRLAAGVVPPTNRWYSGLVFPEAPQPVFPFPLSFAVAGDGLEFGVPPVHVGPAVIAAPHAPEVRLALGAERFELVAGDAVSATLALADDDGELARVVIAEGRPVVELVASRALELSVSPALEPAGEGVWRIGGRYGVDAPGATASGGVLRLPGGGAARFIAAPDGVSATRAAAALGPPVTGVAVAARLGDESATTSLRYADAPGLLVAPPAAREACAGGEALGGYATAYGTAPACLAAVLEWSVPRVRPTAGFALDGLGDDERAELVRLLHADAAAEAELPADSYFGGKALYRLARLLQIAEALGERENADALLDRLGPALLEWSEPHGCEGRAERCVVYDPVLRGAVALAPSFGSEEFNDHHFHFGYFLAAAAAAARADPALAERLAPVVDVLAADLASRGSAAFPTRRGFDPYRSHSWASGFAPFADGNNQESSSEAVNAWNGLAGWAAVRGDAALAADAEWMLSAESHAARALWREPELAELPGFDHEIVSIEWGGKRDYATWFSPEPAAMLGIQLIPMDPVQAVPGDPERIRRSLEEAERGGPAMFADYLLMYRALAGGADAAAARDAASALSPDAIDDANSATAMAAWFASVGR